MAGFDPPESSDPHEGTPGLSDEAREIIKELVRSGAFEDALLQGDIDDLAILRQDLKHKLQARAEARPSNTDGSMAAVDEIALRALLCECLCQNVEVEHRSDGVLILRTHFKFPDGDSYLFYSPQPNTRTNGQRTTRKNSHSKWTKKRGPVTCTTEEPRMFRPDAHPAEQRTACRNPDHGCMDHELNEPCFFGDSPRRIKPSGHLVSADG